MASPAKPASPAQVGAWEDSFQDFRRAGKNSRRRAWEDSFQDFRRAKFFFGDELEMLVFKIFCGPTTFLGDELGMLVFTIAVAVAVAVVVAVEAVDKWESYSWCRASPAFAPTQPLPLSWAVSVLSRG